MNKIFRYSIIFGFLNSYVINFNPESADSSFTEVQIMAGKGVMGMVTRDCSGDVTSATAVPFQDVSIAIDRYTDNYQYGFKGGYFNSQEKKYSYVNRYYEHKEYYKEAKVFYANPNVGLRYKYIGVGLGVVVFSRVDSNLRWGKSRFVPSASLRFGSLESFYVSSNFLNSEPLVSGGGLFDLGLGINFGERLPSVWAGVGLVPSTVLGNFICKVDYPISPDLSLLLRGRYGHDYIDDYGVAMGVKIRL